MKALFGLALVLTGSLTATQAQSNILGSGASFPAPLYNAMFSAYAKETGIRINYQSSNSRSGQTNILERKVDFAASDAYLTNDQLKIAPGQVLHIPMAMAAVVPVYNLPGLRGSLNLNGDVLARLYMGSIKRWNDPSLQQLNPGIALPDQPVLPIFRSDGSGTTSIFVDFLAKSSGVWAQTVSRGPQTNVKWPVGVGADKSEGMVEQVRARVGAIGYLPVGTAKSNKLSYALVANRAGQFVDGGDLNQLSNAANVATIPDDTRVSITNADIGYPISGFTWVLVYRDQQYGNRSLAQARALVKLLRWMIDAGQNLNPRLNYGQVDGPAAARAFRLIESMTYGAQKL
jgi:phosphate transport system substrate-binding protein